MNMILTKRNNDKANDNSRKDYFTTPSNFS